MALSRRRGRLLRRARFLLAAAKRIGDVVKRLHVLLERWIDDSLLATAPGDYVDYQMVEDKIA